MHTHDPFIYLIICVGAGGRGGFSPPISKVGGGGEVCFSPHPNIWVLVKHRPKPRCNYQELITYYSRQITNNIISFLSLHRNTPVDEKLLYHVLLASIRRIPRGCRTKYVPGLTDQKKSI